jgi:hypothetical protein
MNFSFILLRVTYSSKVMMISFPLKFVAPALGIVPSMTGGVLSLGPPEGLLTLAHAPIRMTSADNNDRHSTVLLFISSSSGLRNTNLHHFLKIHFAGTLKSLTMNGALIIYK